jgi:hypothetical protein
VAVCLAAPGALHGWKSDIRRRYSGFLPASWFLPTEYSNPKIDKYVVYCVGTIVDWWNYNSIARSIVRHSWPRSVELSSFTNNIELEIWLNWKYYFHATHSLDIYLQWRKYYAFSFYNIWHAYLSLRVFVHSYLLAWCFAYASLM